MTGQWPAMTGTEHQVSWATEIRQRWIDEVLGIAHQARVSAGQQGMLEDPRYEAFCVGFDSEIDAIVAEYTDASWWIDRRPVDYTQGPARAARKGKLSDLTMRVKKAGIEARDSVAGGSS